MPLAQLPVTHGVKSVSFGTSTYIEYKGQRTPDLSSPADARGRALQADITADRRRSAPEEHAAPLRSGPLTPLLPGH